MSEMNTHQGTPVDAQEVINILSQQLADAQMNLALQTARANVLERKLAERSATSPE